MRRAVAVVVLAALGVLLTACDRGYVVAADADARWHEVLDPTVTMVNAAPELPGLDAEQASWEECSIDASMPSQVYQPPARAAWTLPQDAVQGPRGRVDGVVLTGAATLLAYLHGQGWQTVAVENRRATHDPAWRPVLDTYHLGRPGDDGSVRIRVTVGRDGVEAYVVPAPRLPRRCFSTSDPS